MQLIIQFESLANIRSLVLEGIFETKLESENKPISLYIRRIFRAPFRDQRSLIYSPIHEGKTLDSLPFTKTLQTSFEENILISPAIPLFHRKV